MTAPAGVSGGGRRRVARAVVTGVGLLTPNMRRLTFEGDELATMEVTLPAQWLKVVVPDDGGGGPTGRAYTIRRLHPDRRSMDVDVVLHGGGGPASGWARSAVVGDVLQLGSPRGGHVVDPTAGWRLLAGDETALPAIASILESSTTAAMPTRVVIEMPCMDDTQSLLATAATEIHWLARDPHRVRAGRLLEEFIADLAFPDGPGQAFLAGEATAVRAIRADLVRRVPLAALDAKGYWSLGKADHRDGPG